MPTRWRRSLRLTARTSSPPRLIAPAVGRFEMPPVRHDTLLVHGELDEVVSLADVLQWARPLHLPIVVLPEAGHFFHGRLNQLKQVVMHAFNGQRI